MNKRYIEWAVDSLQTMDYQLSNESPKVIQTTPWSEVVQFKTSVGRIFLKKTPALIYEPPVIQILQDQFGAPVPEVIARNDDLSCFLMKDAGEHLRALLQNKFDVTLACKAIDTFASIQVSLSNNVNILIDAGVPDWRLNEVPSLYKKLVAQDDILKNDGLTEGEWCELKSLQSVVEDLCDHVSRYGVLPTIVQPDFNDNNVLIDRNSGKITMIDLGELAITHPFFSMHNWLQVMDRYYSIKVGDDNYRVMLNRYLQHFNQHDDVLDLFDRIVPLSHVYGALALYRLIEACGVTDIMTIYRGKLSNTLRRFMKNAPMHLSE